ncbi:MAG: phage/plasmid primase, P4 family [Methanocorpusculum sp.]|nr:phage/plasmid primase, P4 family [Methanocorpusculum sp.]
MFFKGYVETKDKKCIEKFKNRTDFKNYKQVQSLPEFAGILAEKTILVDVDDFDQSEILFKIVQDRQLKCRVYETTRGKHFLFNNPDLVNSCSTHSTLACGILADIKLGKRNSYSILKFKDKERKIIYDKADNEEADDIPKWMIPVKTSLEFLNMDAGDGRNNALFSYILTLQSNDFSVEEAREAIRIINEYVLKDPLSSDELETILRDEAFAKPVFFKGTSFLFDKFAVFLKNNHHIIRINGQLHLYKEGIYVPGQEEIESVMIQHIPGLNRAKRQEVMAYLNILIRENTIAAPARFIAFRNGIYDIKDDNFTDFAPEIVITNKIPWDFNRHATSEAIDSMLDNVSCKDETTRALLEEIVGACMYRSNTLAGGKAFILTGTGSNGKSTYLKTLSSLLSEKNISSLDLKKLGDRFSTVMMFGKLANIGDDISNEFVVDTAIFKKVVTGETIDAEQKGQPKFDFKPFCKLLFSANAIPRMGKGSDSQAIMRRLVIVPFEARFSSSDPNFRPEIENELKGQESMEYLIQLGIQGLKRVLSARNYTTSAKMKKELDEYEERNNPLLMFVKECDDEDFNIEGEPTSKVYDRYKEFCLSESLQALSKIEFSRQMVKNFELKIVDRKIGTKKFRIFVEDRG